MSSRMRICICVDATRSASADVMVGSFTTSNGVVADCPFAVTRTEYFPGAASGPTCAGASPQCVTGRVSLPLNRGSSQMCGFSAGVDRSST